MINNSTASMNKAKAKWTELHAASSQGRTEEVRRILELGAGGGVPWSRDPNGNTPLHLAASGGHIEIIKLLRQYGGSPSAENNAKQRPIHLAKLGKSTQISALLAPKISQKVRQATGNLKNSSGGQTDDPEGSAYLAFEEAYQAANAKLQIKSLERLAQIRLSKKDYRGASHLICGALSRVGGGHSKKEFKQRLYGKLMEIEHLFLIQELKVQGGQLIHPSFLRDQLRRIRIQASSDLTANRKIQEVQGCLTQGYEVVLRNLVSYSISLLGETPPCRFAVMGLGSIARREAAPYSDIEFAFVIQTSTKNNTAYFRRLNQLLTLAVISLGETKHELIRPKRVSGVMRPAKSLTPAGFSMDIGGLCPEGKQGIYELIGLPDQLARFQTSEWLKSNDSEIILVNAMTAVSYIIGDQTLVTQYQTRINKILNQELSTPSRSTQSMRLRHERAMQLMKGYVAEFEPRLDQDKVDLRGFNVKQELYRLLQVVVSGLALYYEVKANSTLDRIRALEKMGILSSKGASNLRRAFYAVSRLRLRTHLFYKSEKEVLYHSRNKEDGSGLYLITPKLRKEITDVYRVLIPLHRCATDFLKGSYKAFRISSLYDPRIAAYSDQQRKRFQYRHAYSSAMEAAALNPNDPASRWSLGLVQADLGHAEKAVKELTEALALIRKRGDDRELAAALLNLGNAQRSLGKYDAALSCFEEALRVARSFTQKRPDPVVASVIANQGMVYLELAQFQRAKKLLIRSKSLFRMIDERAASDQLVILFNGLGSAHRAMDQIAEAKHFFEASLRMIHQLHGNQARPDAAQVSINLGNAQLLMDNVKEAQKAFRSSLAMAEKLFEKKDHPIAATALNALGVSYGIQEEYHKAIEPLESALSMSKRLFGTVPNSLSVNVLSNLGRAYLSTIEIDKGVKSLDEALTNFEKLNRGAPHHQHANALSNRGIASFLRGNPGEALKYFQQAIAMQKQVYGNRPHTELLSSHLGLGNVMRDLFRYEEALGEYQCALAIQTKLYGTKDHPLYAKCLMGLGLTYQAMDRKKEASSYFDRALKMQKSLYGSCVDSQAIDPLNSIGAIYVSQGDHKRAAQYYHSVLALIQKRYNGRPHPATVQNYNLLGAVYNMLGKPDQSLEYHLKAQAECKKLYGDAPTPDTARTHSFLGDLHGAQGRNQEAFDSLVVAVSMMDSLYGETPNALMANTLASLGAAYVCQRRIQEGIELMKRSLVMQRKLYGNKPCMETARVLFGIGGACIGIADFAQGLNYIDEAIAMCRRAAPSTPNFLLNIVLRPMIEMRDRAAELQQAPQKWSSSSSSSGGSAK